MAYWARAFPAWKPHIDGNQTYDLSHLQPFKFPLVFTATSALPGRTVEVHVAFSSHVFTERCEEHEEPNHLYSAPHDKRRFSPDRYGWSKRAPAILRDLENRNCLMNLTRDNYVTAQLPGAPAGREYWIFFDIRRAKWHEDAVVVFVQSAYMGNISDPPYGPRPKKYGFRPLVAMTLRGQKPKRK